jgi:RNA polymerase sigma factor (sigma-70 family)
MSEGVLSDNAHDSDASAGDRRLLDRLRGGDEAAFAELFSRHADTVRRFAARQAGHTDADDLAAESFFRMLQAIRRGAGPSENVRTYLLTVARRVAWEWSDRRRDVPVSDDELVRRVEPHADNVSHRAEHHLIARAFSSLPERWRNVLWRIEVEGERPAETAPHFGLSANATAALARRARDGLRAAYLQAHLATGRGEADCRPVLNRLGAYTAGGVRGLEARRIRGHLAGCGSCRSLQDELRQVCAELRGYAGLIAPTAAVFAVGKQLGGAAAAGKAAGVAGGAASGLLGKGMLLAARAKLALAAASVAAVGIVGVSAGPLIADGFGHQGVRADGGDATPYCLPVAPSSSPTLEPRPEPPAPASSAELSTGPAAIPNVVKVTPDRTGSPSVVPGTGQARASTPTAPPTSGGGPAAGTSAPAAPSETGATPPQSRSDPGQPPVTGPTGSSTPSPTRGRTAANSPSPWPTKRHWPGGERGNRPWKHGAWSGNR